MSRSASIDDDAGLQLNIGWKNGEKRGIAAGDVGVGGDDAGFGDDKAGAHRFSKGVAPTVTPSSSTVAPGGELVILRVSAEEEETTQRSNELKITERKRGIRGMRGTLHEYTR
jgi:hypothetical protein